MSAAETESNKNFRTNLLLPALVIGVFIIRAFNVFFSTLLLDIAGSFNVSIGTASQIELISSLIGLIMGLAMSALTIRVKHNLLFLLGVAIFGVGLLGFFFAQSFTAILFFDFFIGAGVAMISIMTYALIGGLFRLEKRGWAVGLTVSTGMAAYVIAAPLSGFIANIADWRAVLLWFIFPLFIVCLGLTLLGVPSVQPNTSSTTPALYSKALKQILLNKSAVACAVATMLFTCISVIPVYAVSFYRITFNVSPTLGGIFAAIAASGGVLGGICGGRLVNRCGRKPLTVVASVVSGVSAVLFTYVPMWLSVALWAVAATTAAITISALFSLVLEQVPVFKASIMSINSAFQSIGLILGLIIGGLVLNLYHNNFQLLMTIFGVSGVASAPVILLFAVDPCKSANMSSLERG